MKPDTLWGSVFPRLNIAGREMESGTDFVGLRARGMEFGCFPSAVGSHWRVSMRISTLSTDHAGSCGEQIGEAAGGKETSWMAVWTSIHSRDLDQGGSNGGVGERMNLGCISETRGSIVVRQILTCTSCRWKNVLPPSTVLGLGHRTCLGDGNMGRTDRVQSEKRL